MKNLIADIVSMDCEYCYVVWMKVPRFSKLPYIDTVLYFNIWHNRSNIPFISGNFGWHFHDRNLQKRILLPEKSECEIHWDISVSFPNICPPPENCPNTDFVLNNNELLGLINCIRTRFHKPDDIHWGRGGGETQGAILCTPIDIQSFMRLVPTNPELFNSRSNFTDNYVHFLNPLHHSNALMYSQRSPLGITENQHLKCLRFNVLT